MSSKAVEHDGDVMDGTDMTVLDVERLKSILLAHQISTYTPTSIYSKNKNSLVFGAIDHRSCESKIIKYIHAADFTSKELDAIEEVYAHLSSHNISCVAIPEMVDSKISGKLLIFDEKRFVTLKQFLSEYPCPLEKLVTIFINIVMALKALQESGVVHGAITVDRLLIQPNTLKVVLSDFDFSRIKSQHIAAISPPLINLDACHFVAPEFWLESSKDVFIDYSSDQFSCGMVFLYCLLNGLPKEVERLNKVLLGEEDESLREALVKQRQNILHGFIGYSLTSPIPRCLAQILEIMLSFDASSRYRDIDSLVDDLSCAIKLIKNNQFNQCINSHNRRDLSRFNISDVLYGRKNALNMLKQAFELSLKGHSRSVLVSGESGSGKTSLVSALRETCRQRGGMYIEGKFDIHHTAIPYEAIKIAFNDLVEKVLADKTHTEDWRGRIEVGLGPNLSLIQCFFSDFNRLMGFDQVDQVYSLEDVGERLPHALADFIRIFIGVGHPVVWFIDDIQFADLSSLHVLEKLVTHYPVEGLLLVFSSRTKREVSNSAVHHFMSLFSSIEGQSFSKRCEYLPLKALSVQDIEHMLEDTFDGTLNRQSDLAVVFHKKTQGNCFFVREYLKSIYELGLFNYSESEWTWDEGTLESLQVFDSVTQLIEQSCDRLSYDQRLFLHHLACLGSEFSRDQLDEWLDFSPSDIQAYLTLLVDFGLLSRVKKVQTSQVFFRFSHDKIQELSSSLFDTAKKNAVHWNIALRMIACDQKGGVVPDFSIVSHLLQSQNYSTKRFSLGVKDIPFMLLEGFESKNHLVAEYFYRAAKQANQSSAYKLAFEYAKYALDLMACERLGVVSLQFSLNVRYEVAVCNYHSKNYPGLLEVSNWGIEHSRSDRDLTRFYDLKIKYYLSLGDLVNVVNTGQEALERIGRPLKVVSKVKVAYKLYKLKSIISRVSDEKILALPKINNELDIAVLRIMTSMLSAAYFFSPKLFALVAIERLMILMRSGHSHFSPSTLSTAGLIFCSAMNRVDIGYRLGLLGVKLMSAQPANKYETRVYHGFNTFIGHYKEPLSSLIQGLEKGYALGKALNDYEFSAYSMVTRGGYSIYGKKNICQQLEEGLFYEKEIQSMNQPTPLVWHRITLQVLYEMKSVRLSTDEWSGPYFFEAEGLKELRSRKDRSGQGHFHLSKAMYYVMLGRWSSVAEHVEAFGYFDKAHRSTLFIPLFHFFSIAVASHLPSQKMKVVIQRQLTQRFRLIQRYASHGSRFHRAIAFLAEAEILILKGRTNHVQSRLLSAIEYANQAESVFLLIYALERLGQFHLSQNAYHLARQYLMDALTHIERWGALCKKQHMLTTYENILGDDPSTL